MGANSRIEWTHHTFNPWIGCAKISPGCKNCYASVETYVRVQRARGRELWGADVDRHVTSESNWRAPLRWNEEARAAGRRDRVFCASLADVFEQRLDLEEPRARLFNLIAETPSLDWLLLTKRPEFIMCTVDDLAAGGVELARRWLVDRQPPTNVWLGATAEDQEHADARVPILAQMPAAVRFLSLEPLLELVRSRSNYFPGWRWPDVDWVIVGGESGPNARPARIDWLRQIVKDCRLANVPVFVKQLGSRIIGGDGLPYSLGHKGGDWSQWADDLRVRELPRQCAS